MRIDYTFTKNTSRKKSLDASGTETNCQGHLCTPPFRWSPSCARQTNEYVHPWKIYIVLTYLWSSAKTTVFGRGNLKLNCKKEATETAIITPRGSGRKDLHVSEVLRSEVLHTTYGT